MSRIHAYIACQELHDLAFRYALAVDTRDATMLASLFKREGTIGGIESQARYCGAAGFQRLIKEVGDSFDVTMHNVFNQTFDIAGDETVTGYTTCIASHLIKADPPSGGGRVLDFAMRYHNRYAIEDGAWKFAERQLEVLWIETREVSSFDRSMLGRDLAGFAP